MLNSLAIAKLMLEIQFPTLEECWEDGYNLSIAHSSIENPHKFGTASYYHWQDGWWQGRLAKCKDEYLDLQKAANDDRLIEEQIQL
jgi:hypothetical protein